MQLPRAAHPCTIDTQLLFHGPRSFLPRHLASRPAQRGRKVVGLVSPNVSVRWVNAHVAPRLQCVGRPVLFPFSDRYGCLPVRRRALLDPRGPLITTILMQDGRGRAPLSADFKCDLGVNDLQEIVTLAGRKDFEGRLSR
jgi:hypothetical protein